MLEAREPLQGHQEATGSSEIQNNEDQGSDNDSSTQVSMANSQHSKPPDQRADFLQVVFQDIQQDYGHYNLEARRIAFLSVSIGMLKLKSIKLNRIRQPMGPDQRTFRLTVEILFLLDLGAGLFIAVSLSELPLPYGVTIAGMVLYGLYVCVATVVLFFNYILQRQLILSQLMARDTMPKSDEGWNGLFRYLSSQTERSSSQASLQSALSRSDSIPVNEAGEDELESNLGSVRRRHTGWALENQSGESIA